MMALILFLSVSPQIKAQEVDYRVFVDGKTVSLRPGIRIEQGIIMVPAVAFFQQLGFAIQVTPGYVSGVEISNKSTIITFISGTNRLYVNGKEIKMPTTSQEYFGSTYLPLRSIAQALGKPLGNNIQEKYAWLGNKPSSVTSLLPELQGKDFRNAIWGMSVEQIKNSENSPLIYNSEEFDSYKNVHYKGLTFSGTYLGFKSHYIYAFAGAKKSTVKFYQGYIDFPEQFTNMQNYIDRFFSISSKMEQAYGTPKKFSYGAGEDPKSWPVALSLNELSLTHNFTVGRNEYSLNLTKDNYLESDGYPEISITVSEKIIFK